MYVEECLTVSFNSPGKYPYPWSEHNSSTLCMQEYGRFLKILPGSIWCDALVGAFLRPYLDSLLAPRRSYFIFIFRRFLLDLRPHI